MLTGAYAADALPEDERRVFVEHLETCPSCAQEVRELTATTARLATAVTSPAPPGMRERVLTGIQQVRQVSPSTARPEPRPAVRGAAWRRWATSPLAAAASLLLVLCLALAVVAV